MANRIYDFMDFFIEEGIIEEGLTVSINNEEETSFLSWNIHININENEIAQDRYSEAESITCNYDERLLNSFNKVEITFFHELGHYCDFAFRHDFYPEDLLEDWETCNAHNDIIQEVWSGLIKLGEGKMAEEKILKYYRSFGLEKAADDNARLLMNYYLERKEGANE